MIGARPAACAQGQRMAYRSNEHRIAVFGLLGAGKTCRLVGQMAGCVVAGLAFAVPAFARDHDVQQWTLLIAQGHVAEDIVVQADMQPRLTNDASRLGQFQLSPSIGYKVSKKITVFLGYMYVRTDPVDRPATDEHRIYQHVIYPVGKIGDVSITARTRLEERMVEGAEDLSLRFRQQLRAQIPLGDKGDPNLVVWTEAFYNFNNADWGPREGLDRWRNLIGVDIPITKGLIIEPAYLDQIVFRPGQDRHDHVLNMTLSYQF
ncbi:MAG: DUF2490 domain-containing protein [Porphyrobacter sp.]|nr:DUF2490 domain-containing protein [Porphyrobacter sp.]